MLLNEELADWSAAYLAMWIALESFDPNADRCSDPVSFGDREERIKTAQNAIARLEQRHGIADEKQQDIRAFHKHLKRLIDGNPFGAAVVKLSQRLRDTGSSLADQSVIAAGMASR